MRSLLVNPIDYIPDRASKVQSLEVETYQDAYTYASI
jgi:hypothetical protein